MKITEIISVICLFIQADKLCPAEVVHSREGDGS